MSASNSVSTEAISYLATIEKINAIKKSNPGNTMAYYFDKTYFNTLSAEHKQRLISCCKSGIENANSIMGCYAMQASDYDDFKPFFKPVLERYHNVDLDVKGHVNGWDLADAAGIQDFCLPEDGKLDISKFGVPALSLRIRTARNLKNFPLPGAMTQEDRVNLEEKMGAVFDALIAKDGFGGEYVSLTPGHPKQMTEERYQELVKAHIMFKDMSADSYLVNAGIAGHWPYGRGCYISADKAFMIWCGEEDHLRIIAMTKTVILNEVFDRLKTAVDVVEDLIPGGCAKSDDFGVITSCPTNIGTGMRASVHIPLPNLTQGKYRDTR